MTTNLYSVYAVGYQVTSVNNCVCSPKTYIPFTLLLRNCLEEADVFVMQHILWLGKQRNFLQDGEAQTMNCLNSHLKQIKIGKRFIATSTVKQYNSKLAKKDITHIMARHLTEQLYLRGKITLTD